MVSLSCAVPSPGFCWIWLGALLCFRWLDGELECLSIPSSIVNLDDMCFILNNRIQWKYYWAGPCLRLKKDWKLPTCILRSPKLLIEIQLPAEFPLAAGSMETLYEGVI